MKRTIIVCSLEESFIAYFRDSLEDFLNESKRFVNGPKIIFSIDMNKNEDHQSFQDRVIAKAKDFNISEIIGINK